MLAMNLRTGDQPIRVFGQLVTPNYFEFLGVTPSLGRGFRADEGVVPDRDPLAVISDDLWRRVFAPMPRSSDAWSR
jgi:hypothetical protein